MAKNLILIATFLSVLLAVAMATTFTTTVTTTAIDDDEANPGRQTEQCQQQIQGKQFQLCQRYLFQRSRGQYEGSDDEVIAMSTNPGAGQQEYELVRGCCHEMRMVPTECRCEALGYIVRQQQQQGRIRGEQLQEAYEKVRSLPRLCNPQAGQCEIRSMFLY